MRVSPSTGRDGPLFAWPDGRPYLYKQFMTRLRTLPTLGQDDSTAYGAHSFRRGGATLAARAGLRAEEIKALGDWRSDTYQRYIAKDTACSTSKMLEYSTKKVTHTTSPYHRGGLENDVL